MFSIHKNHKYYNIFFQKRCSQSQYLSFIEVKWLLDAIATTRVGKAAKSTTWSVWPLNKTPDRPATFHRVIFESAEALATLSLLVSSSLNFNRQWTSFECEPTIELDGDDDKSWSKLISSHKIRDPVSYPLRSLFGPVHFKQDTLPPRLFSCGGKVRTRSSLKLKILMKESLNPIAIRLVLAEMHIDETSPPWPWKCKHSFKSQSQIQTNPSFEPDAKQLLLVLVKNFFLRLFLIHYFW
jgi:hypothetical protein